MSKIIIAIPRGRIIGELKKILMKTTFAPEAEMFDNKSRKLTFLSNFSSSERSSNNEKTLYLK